MQDVSGFLDAELGKDWEKAGKMGLKDDVAWKVDFLIGLFLIVFWS